MTSDPIFTVFVSGWRRVVHAPAIAGGALVVTLVLVLPLGYALRGSIESHLGRSTTAAGVADGIDYGWWQEFTSQASGIGSTFTPAILGFAATLDNVSGVLDGQAEIGPIAAVLASWLVAWTFLSGGIIDRYARQRRTRAHGFFAACGAHFFRFLRLGVIAGLAYGFLFLYVHEWLFADLYVDVTRDMDTERRAFAVRLALYAIFGALLMVTNVILDYARIRIVVEDRRSALGGVLASLRLLARHPAAFLLYGLNALTFLALAGIWALAAPDPGRPGVALWLTFAAGQAYILARLLVKLQFVASQTAFFQSRLAHATYTAAPAPSWPDSPAAETMTPAP